MADDMDAIMGFIMGNKQRERVVQVLGSKGKMSAEKVAKVGRIPAPMATKILAEMAEKNLVIEETGVWYLTETGQEIEKEMTDRFGEPPAEVRVLVALEKIRALASALEIDEILEDSRGVRIRISGNSRVDPKKIVAIIKKDRRISLDPSDSEMVLFKPAERVDEKKLLEIKKWLQQIS